MNSFFDRIDGLLEKACAPKLRNARNLISIAMCLMSGISIFLLMFSSICVVKNGKYQIIAANAFKDLVSKDKVIASFSLLQLAAYLIIVACIAITVVMIAKCLIRFSNEDAVADTSRSCIVFSFVTVALYTVFTFVFSPINKMIGGYSESRVSYLPLIVISIASLLYALLVGTLISYRRNKKIENATEKQKLEIDRKKHRRKLFLHQLEATLFALATAVVSILALMSDIVTVSFDKSEMDIPDMTISGTEILMGKSELMTKGERIIGYMVFAMFFVTVAFLLLSILSFVSRSSQCNKMVVSSIIASSVSCAAVGLFGQYYKMVQALNADVVSNLLDEYAILVEDLLKYEITSKSLIYCCVLIGVLSLLFIRRPLTKANEEYKQISRYDSVLSPAAQVEVTHASIELASVDDTDNGNADVDDVSENVLNTDALMNSENEDEKPENSSDAKALPDARLTNAQDYDPCPAFTELDGKINVYADALQNKMENLFRDPTLPNLVNYIVQYARDSKHHLFYTHESIATFLAGLGATRLTILQGMSGTGKTSLPKIVSEALMSVCDIIEVESSWRDKNELLGYYNEFNKVYTPKKFTQALYRACLNSDTLTFIVLDEMNLSRIEYYFSDFLSLMENEPDKRELQLLNTPLARVEDGQRKEYAALVDRHTLKIPENVWFIGTANRDESTYDISDKVYDRAHTMNFDKRAQKPTLFDSPMPARYLPAKELIRLFEEARNTVKVDIDNYPVVKRAEMLLEPYNISFGNRIAIQIETFVSIYASCFTPTGQVIMDALDIIMLSKVVKKLELKSVEDKESLSMEFDKIGLRRCSRFILSLKED